VFIFAIHSTIEVTQAKAKASALGRQADENGFPLTLAWTL